MNSETESNLQTGVILPTSVQHRMRCSTCRKAMTKWLTTAEDMLSSETHGLLFCSNCESWYHQICLGAEEKTCPSCDGSQLEGPQFYCQKCAKPTSVLLDSRWPNFNCSKCKDPTSLAVLFSAGTDETIKLLIVGAIALVAFIACMVFDVSQFLKYVSASFAALLSLPWILILLAELIKTVMPMGWDLGEITGWGAGTENLLHREADEFKRKSMMYRYSRVYVYWMTAAFSAAIILAVGLGVAYFFATLARNWN